MKNLKNSLFKLGLAMSASLAGCSIEHNLDKSAYEHVLVETQPVFSPTPGLIILSDEEITNQADSTLPSEGGTTLNVYGPLNDRRIVRGNLFRVTFSKSWGASPFESYTLNYGFHTDETQSVVMSLDAKGSFSVVVEAPTNAEGLHFTIEGSQGMVYRDEDKSYTLKTYESAITVNRSSNNLTVMYAGPAVGYHETLEYAWNSTNLIQKKTMTATNISGSYYYPDNYAMTTVSLPETNSTLFFQVDGNLITDNNHGNYYIYDWSI